MSTTSPAQSQGMGGVGSPISNDVYNLITVLQTKMQGLDAYRKYTQDGGNPQLWQYLAQQDTQAVQYLMQELERIVQTGQHRLHPPVQVTGQPGHVAGSPIS